MPLSTREEPLVILHLFSDIFIELNYEKLDYVSELFLQLGGYYEKCENTIE